MKQYEFTWDDKQVWWNRAFVTAENEERAFDLFYAEKFDYPVDSDFSHYIEGIQNVEVKEHEIVSSDPQD